MAQFGKYRVGLNTNAKPFLVIMTIVMLFIWLYVGDLIISVIMGLIQTTAETPAGGIYGTAAPYTTYYSVPITNLFYNVFKLFGVHTNDISNTGGGLIGVVGIILGVAVLLQALKVTRV